MWRTMMRMLRTPIVRATFTKGRWRSETAMPRTRRVYHGHQVTTMAMPTLRRLGPRKATRAMVRIRLGNARNTSVTRMITSSTMPP